MPALSILMSSYCNAGPVRFCAVCMSLYMPRMTCSVLFSEEIQSQILTPFQACIRFDGTTHHTVLQSPNEESSHAIELMGFEVKPFKTSSSTVIKLLAKPDALAMKIFDKLGVRFVTATFLTLFQVVRFLIRQNVISFPHIMPDQSSNNLYPVDLFMKVCDDLSHRLDTLDEKSIQVAFDQKNARGRRKREIPAQRKIFFLAKTIVLLNSFHAS